MILLEPKAYQPVSGGPVIFLAGPIHGAPPWQPHAFDLIRELDGTMIVVTPRRFHSPDHYRYRTTSTLQTFHRQRAWERHYMDMASQRGCVLFWLPGPAGPLDGMVYGATTRYEMGLWSSRFAHDSTVGLCVGTDGAFPTVHTIAYDLEHEMAGRTVHTTLEDTVRAAVETARYTHDHWMACGEPGVPLESDLNEVTHEDLKQAYLSLRLDDNPMNDPEQLRATAMEMLDREMDRFVGDPVEVEEVTVGAEAGEAMEADVAELEDLPGDWLDPAGAQEASVAGADSARPSGSERERLHQRMRRTGEWYLNGRRVDGPKYLAIGRSTYYIPFFQRLAVELGAPVYQSDYLEWIDPRHPEASLAYYLATAERIDVNLEGVSAEDLRKATTWIGRKVGGRWELPQSYMTSWEINQLYHTDWRIPVFWHTGGSMTHAEAFAVLGERIPAEGIIDD